MRWRPLGAGVAGGRIGAMTTYRGALIAAGKFATAGRDTADAIAGWREYCPPGDVNCDGVNSVGDLSAFVLALTNPAAYAVQSPDCQIERADLDANGAVSVGDIGPFVALLTRG